MFPSRAIRVVSPHLPVPWTDPIEHKDSELQPAVLPRSVNHHEGAVRNLLTLREHTAKIALHGAFVVIEYHMSKATVFLPNPTRQQRAKSSRAVEQLDWQTMFPDLPYSARLSIRDFQARWTRSRPPTGRTEVYFLQCTLQLYSNSPKRSKIW